MKLTKKLVALLLSLTMVVATASVAFAKGSTASVASPLGYVANSANLVVAKTANAFLKAAQSMLENSVLFQLSDLEMTGEEEETITVDTDDTYQTGRILVCPEGAATGNALADELEDNLDIASDAISYNGWYFLQFDSKKATKTAYKALKDAFGAENVVLDRVTQVNLPKATEVKATTDYSQYKSWGIANMGMDKVRDKLKASGNKTSVKVAVLDTGISLLETTFLSRITTPFDFVAFTAFPLDFNGHGTHCSGTIYDATPSNVKIMPVKTMTAIGAGTIFHTFIGLLYAQVMGADVVNMSLASIDELNLKPYDSLLKSMVESGMTICVAAGNEKADVKTSYPSNSEYVITVGATNKYNRVDRDYSNYGDKIDFVAPGTDVKGRSTVFGMPTVDTMTGTSMATPHITAACALIKCVHPKYTQSQVYNVLKKYAVDIEANGKDKYAGWGRVDLTGFASEI